TEYDKNGNVIAEIDGLGHRTEYRYDTRDRRIEIRDARNPVGLTLLSYDAVDNIKTLTDPVGNTIRYRYDARYRIREESNETLGVSRFLDYDDIGNPTQVTDRNGRVREFVYDGLNRQIQEVWLDSEENPIRITNTTYDAASQLLLIEDPDSQYRFDYDLQGRLISVDNSGTSGVPAVVLNYNYDVDDNLLLVSETIEGVAAGITSHEYDDLDRLINIRQSGEGVSDKRVDFGYDPLGRFERINRYGDLEATQLGVESTYSYDGLNRLVRLEHNNASETVAFYDLVYDNANRLTQITDIDETTNYSYDETNQLLGAQHSSETNLDEFYDYDANGNREASHLNADGYVTGVNNRLISDGTYNYAYNNEGNLVQQTKITTGEVREFEWDHRNRLIAVIDHNQSGEIAQRVSFTYDAMDRRIAKTVDNNLFDASEGVATYFVYHGSDVWLEFEDADGAGGIAEPVLNQRYLYGPQVDQVLVQEGANGSLIWHLTDYQGTVRDLANSMGTVINHLIYDSYGNVISQANEAVETRYLYTGREWDKEIGLYYYRARYYAPEIGRFISEDPIGLAGNDANLYRYTTNQPIGRVDPQGTTSIELQLLLSTYSRPSQARSVHRYNIEYEEYAQAFREGNNWYLRITDPPSLPPGQQEKRPTGGPIPWLGGPAPLKGGQGRAVFRPIGTVSRQPDQSPLVPTIELQKDNNMTHMTPGYEQVTRVKFPWMMMDENSCLQIPEPVFDRRNVRQPDERARREPFSLPRIRLPRLPVPLPIPIPFPRPREIF
ncbi:RHS repeat protein, partial [bacterium]|nr:RHS repeat protein [bacterium]